MARVKSYYHDDICGIADQSRKNDAEMVPLAQAARERLATKIGDPKQVASILAGDWDHTPAYRNAYGEEFLFRQGAAQ